MVANILPAHPLPPSDPEDGVSRSKFIFLEHGHADNKNDQIKEIHQCSNMVANILLADTPDSGDGVNRSKCNFFTTWPCCISI